MLNDIFHSLSPVAFSVGGFDIYWYGLAYLTGFVLGALIIYYVAKSWKAPIAFDDVSSLMMGIAIGVVLGGRLGYVLFYGAGYYVQNPSHIFMFSEGGMSFHGGLVGAIIGALISCKFLHLRARTIIDLGCIAAPVGLFFGRLANFVNGELWGKPTDAAWAVSFPTGGGIPRHPSQLYEALLEGLVLFIILFCMSRKKPPLPQGTFLGTFTLLYGIFRFIVEFVRVPDQQLGYIIGSMTMGQLLSIPLIIFGIIELMLAHDRQWPQIAYESGYIRRISTVDGESRRPVKGRHAVIMTKKEEKAAKKQAKIDVKNAELAAREMKKQAAKQAKIDERNAKIAAKEAAKQAKIDEKNARIAAKEAAKLAKSQARNAPEGVPTITAKNSHMAQVQPPMTAIEPQEMPEISVPTAQEIKRAPKKVDLPPVIKPQEVPGNEPEVKQESKPENNQDQLKKSKKNYRSYDKSKKRGK